MKIRPFVLSLLIILVTSASFSQQNASKKIMNLCNKAKEAINLQQFDKAEKYLQKSLSLDSLYADAYVLYGDIYNVTLQSEKAADCYNKAISLLKNPKPNLFFIAAGEELKCGRYQNAQKNFNLYLEKTGNESSLMDEVMKGLETCAFGIEALKNPVDFNPVNLGQSINSEWDEYLAALTADEEEFIFTVRRPRDNNTICAFCQMEEDFYSSLKENGEWQPRKPLDNPVNSSYNEGAQCISQDGRFLFFTLCNADFGYGSCDLYWSKKIGSRWSRPRNFGQPVNSPFWESQPTISPDGKTIYFASNRPGGNGKIDIWKTEMTEEGVFTVPENLGIIINTKDDDTAPFIHADGKTLFFASDGHRGMGGKDIFYSTLLLDNSWTEPINLGYPINTPADEINILINASGNTAYFASDKDGGFGGLDLYSFELDERLRPTPVTYIKGRVQDAVSLHPIQASIELFDLNHNQIITSTSSDPETGEFLACILTGTNVLLNVSNPLYPFYSENFQLKKSYSKLDPFLKDINLRKPDVGSTFILRNIFFDFDKSSLKNESFVELDKLFDYLKQNPSLNIEIGGHTDNSGSDDYNIRLSLDRSKEVYNYLILKGVDASRLTYKGYGKNNPIASNDTEEGRAANRRTEFKIISR